MWSPEKGVSVRPDMTGKWVMDDGISDTPIHIIPGRALPNLRLLICRVVVNASQDGRTSPRDLNSITMCSPIDPLPG